jgi:guanyl-specific ribonuclease Sa
MEDYLNGVITFFYVVEKPGEVHKGKLNIISGPDVNIPERWG